MTHQDYDHRRTLLDSLPRLDDVKLDPNDYITTAVLVRGYLEIIRADNPNEFPPEPHNESERALRRMCIQDYRSQLLQYNPELKENQTKVNGLYFCRRADDYYDAEQRLHRPIADFLAECSERVERGNGKIETRWCSQSKFGLLRYSQGPVATHVVCLGTSTFINTPLFSPAAFNEDLSRIVLNWKDSLMSLDARSYSIHFALDTIRQVIPQLERDRSSIGDVKVARGDGDRASVEITMNNFFSYRVTLSISDLTMRLQAQVAEINRT